MGPSATIGELLDGFWPFLTEPDWLKDRDQPTAMRFHRSERKLMGLLSALRYIHHIAKHYSVPLLLKFRLCCNNKGLIKRVTRVFQTKWREFVNETMLPERDLIEAIVTSTSEGRIMHWKLLLA